MVPIRMYWFAYRFGNVKRLHLEELGQGTASAVPFRRTRNRASAPEVALASNCRDSCFWVAQPFERCGKCSILRLALADRALA